MRFRKHQLARLAQHNISQTPLTIAVANVSLDLGTKFS